MSVERQPPALAVLGLAAHEDGAAVQIAPALRKLERTLPALVVVCFVAGALLIVMSFALGRMWLGIATMSGVAPALIVLAAYAVLRAPGAVRARPSRRIRMVTVVAVLLGIIQGGAFGIVFVDGGVWLFAGIVAVAAIGTLAALSALPVIAGAYLAVFACSALVAATRLAHLPAALLLFAVLLPVVVALVRADRAELRRRAQEQKSGATANALIAMLEESGRLWFWETDRDGNISHISAALAAQFNGRAGRLIGRPLGVLITDDGDQGVGAHVGARKAFSDRPVRVDLPTGARWWAMTGMPVTDSDGHFLGFRGSAADITESRRSEVEAGRLARFDPLTGLPNRPIMMRLLEQVLADKRGDQVRCALLQLELDAFEAVGEAYGQAIADAVLKLAAKRLETVIGEKGRVGRVGSATFDIVLPAAPTDPDLARLGSELIWKLSQAYRLEGLTVKIDTSVGIAVGPADGHTAEALLRNADLALTTAKGEGKGLARLYRPDMHVRRAQRRTLETELADAFAAQGLQVAYQPVVCANSEAIVAFEALARWMHPVRWVVPPPELVPAAEEIDERVLRIACLEAAHWPAAVRVAVAISSSLLARPSFPGIVTNALAAASLDPARLEIQVSESLLRQETADADAIFAQLKDIGVRLALGDFGTGYSALGYLRDAPFDKIRIDRSLVKDAAVPGSRSAMIIAAIVSLADALGMDSGADGAETQDDLILIRSLGCSHIQGDVFGAPMAAAEARRKTAGAAASAAAQGIPRIRAPRVALLRPALLHHATRGLPVTIRNISSSGAQVEIAEPLPDGSEVKLELGRGALEPAIVRWSQEGRMGIAFQRRIDVAAVLGNRTGGRAVA